MSDLQRKLSTLLNYESTENESNTPDYILAEFMISCLAAFNAATIAREKWYGVRFNPITTPPKEPKND
ncbi:MAG: hypothetical protein JRI80_00340 [Deltaproteobacteria bacterium]|nr:hypothetical protein [Deltaproteobacteria bacterium]